MTEIIQHIENEKQPYRVPVFTIKPNNIHFSDKVEKKASVIRLTTCDFVTNYYNISYTSNCLRWLRIPEYETNDLLTSNYSTAPTNPYFKTILNNTTTPILCKLYITPGAYTNVVDLITEINSRMYDSFVNIFDIHSNPTTIYQNQKFNYQYSIPGSDADKPYSEYIPSIFTRHGIIQLKNTVISSASISSLETGKVYYYVPGSFRYVKNNMMYTLRDCIVCFENYNLSDVSLINSTIDLPYLKIETETETMHNSFNVVYTTSKEYNIYDSSFDEKVITSEDYQYPYKNILCSGLLGNAENVRITVWSGGKEVISSSNGTINIDSAMLNNFENVSKINKFNDRFEYQTDDYENHKYGEYIYRYAKENLIINPNLTISLLIPNVQLISFGGGIYEINFTTNSNITILNTSGTTPIVLDGYIAQCANTHKYPNCKMFGTLDDMPKIKFLYNGTQKLPTDTITLKIDLKGEYEDVAGEPIDGSVKNNETIVYYVWDDTPDINKIIPKGDEENLQYSLRSSLKSITSKIQNHKNEELISDSLQWYNEKKEIKGTTVVSSVVKSYPTDENKTVFTTETTDLVSTIPQKENKIPSDSTYTITSNVSKVDSITLTTVTKLPFKSTDKSSTNEYIEKDVPPGTDGAHLVVNVEKGDGTKQTITTRTYTDLTFKAGDINAYYAVFQSNDYSEEARTGSKFIVKVYYDSSDNVIVDEFIEEARYTDYKISGDVTNSDGTKTFYSIEPKEYTSSGGLSYIKRNETNIKTTMPIITSFSSSSISRINMSYQCFAIHNGSIATMRSTNNAEVEFSPIPTDGAIVLATVYLPSKNQPSETYILENAKVKIEWTEEKGATVTKKITSITVVDEYGVGLSMIETKTTRGLIEDIINEFQFWIYFVSFDKNENKLYSIPIIENNYTKNADYEESNQGLTITVTDGSTSIGTIAITENSENPLYYDLTLAPVESSSFPSTVILKTTKTEVIENYDEEQIKTIKYIDNIESGITLVQTTTGPLITKNITVIINEEKYNKINANNGYVRKIFTMNTEAYVNATKALAVRIRKAKTKDIQQESSLIKGIELNDVFGVDICPLYKLNEESEWKLDLSSEHIKFDSIKVIQNGNDESVYTQIDGTIERGDNILNAKTNKYTFNLFEYYLIDRKYTIDSGLCSAGIISMSPLPTEQAPFEDLFNFNSNDSIVKEVKAINSNIDLTYDDYYYLAYRMIMEKGAESNFIFLTTANENNKLGIKFFSPVIPITSDTIYTNTLDFLKVMQDPNFNLKTTTTKMEQLIEINDIDGTFNLIDNNYKLTKYNNENANVDDFFYNFEINKNDLWSKLGFVPPKIEYNCSNLISYKSSNKADESDMNEQVYPIYTIKGIYYSETLYKGPVKLQQPIKIESTNQNDNMSTIKKIILPKEYDIFKFLSSDENSVLFNTYFNKTVHYATQLMMLSIPKTIEVKMTQNKDVEQYLNSNEITGSIANIGQYQVVRDNSATISAIQQQLTINTTVEIPDDKPIYVFLTNGNQIYSLMDTVATLNIECIN